MIRNNDISVNVEDKDNNTKTKHKVGRNDLCYCGSGKKYKKCCMKKDQEELRENDLYVENETITDTYLTVEEYIELSGYPLLKFDFFLLEILNMIGDMLHKASKLDIKKIKEIVKETYIYGKDFYKGCLKCKHKCLIDPLKNVSFKSLEDKEYNIKRLPLKLQERKAINFFYIEFFCGLSIKVQKQLINIMDEKTAGEISCTVYFSLINYVAENCLVDCKDACVINHDKSGYCKFCTFGRRKLPCPKKNEVDYEFIKALKSDMEH